MLTRRKFEIDRLPILVHSLGTKHHEELLTIEDTDDPSRWVASDLYEFLNRSDSCRVFLAEPLYSREHDARVIGFAAVVVYRTKVHLVKLVVRADYRRNGVGKALLAQLCRKVLAPNRSVMRALVDERNTAAQFFLRKHGFRWIATQTPRGAELDDSAYLMECRIGHPDTAGTLAMLDGIDAECGEGQGK